MLDNNLPCWRQDLKSSRKKEGKLPSNRWIQLATVSEENEPRLRTVVFRGCLLYTSPSPRDRTRARMPSSA